MTTKKEETPKPKKTAPKKKVAKKVDPKILEDAKKFLKHEHGVKNTCSKLNAIHGTKLDKTKIKTEKQLLEALK